MNDPLKSPTCRDCAIRRGLRVPGDVHTAEVGVCSNCGKRTHVSPASDWIKPGQRYYPEAMD